MIGRMLQAAGRDSSLAEIGVPSARRWTTRRSRRFTSWSEQLSARDDDDVPFRIALWLNFAADHLDRHPSPRYAGARRAFANQTPGGLAVVNADDRVVMEKAARTAAQRVLFSPSGAIDQACR